MPDLPRLWRNGRWIGCPAGSTSPGPLFPIVQATVLAAGFFYIFTALVVDILYAYVNPRIRYE